MEYILTTTDLSKQYGRFKALDGLSMRVPKGAIYGFIENLKMQYQLLGLSSYDGIPELLKLVGLENTGKKKAKNFSLGMKQRLGIAIALAGSPDFLVLDEPINGRPCLQYYITFYNDCYVEQTEDCCRSNLYCVIFPAVAICL